MALKTGHGATIGSTLWSGWDTSPALLTSIGGASFTREALDTTHLNITATGTPSYVYGTMIPGDIVRGGTIELEGFYQPELPPPPVGGASETWTITYPAPGTSTLAFAGFLTAWTGGTAQSDQVMRFTATLQIAGAVTHSTGS